MRRTDCICFAECKHQPYLFPLWGADPHNLSYFWILPPLAGIIVQPIVGAASDRTWTRFGRRIPYLFIGSLVAVLVMCLLPNAGSFGMAVSTAMIFGLVSLMFLDTSINMAMQPFKMMVGDMVNEKQKGLAYSIQSFLCNAGSLVGYLFPFIFAWVGISNTAPPRGNSRFRNLLVLYRGRHSDILRYLYNGQSQGIKPDAKLCGELLDGLGLRRPNRQTVKALGRAHG